VSPTSRDPRKRARQLANLRKGGITAPVGNRRAVKHGGYAAVAADRLDAKAREVFAALAADVLCRLDGMCDCLARCGVDDAKGVLRVVELDLERRLRAEAADHLDSLGMTPRSVNWRE